MNPCKASIVAALLVGVISLGALLPALGQDLAGTLFAQGMQLYGKQDYAGAVDYLGQVCDMMPDHHQARFYLIYSYLAVRNPAQALRHVTILCQKSPGVPQYETLRIQIQQSIEMEAASKPKQGTSLVPKEVMFGGYTSQHGASGTLSPEFVPPPPRASPKIKPLTDLDRAMADLDGEHFASATKLLEGIIKKDPKNIKALHYRGVVEYNQLRFSDAREWFKKALAVKKDQFETQFLLGETFLREGDNKEAEAEFQKALAIKEDVFALLNLADAKRKQGKVPEALEVYKKILKLDSNIIEAKVAVAETQLDQGKVDEASNAINDVLAAEPGNAYAHYVKGRIFFQNDLAEDATAEFKIAINLAPTNELFRLSLAKALLKTFKTGEATDIAAELLGSKVAEVDARLIIAESHIMNGATGDAEAHLNQAEALRKDPQIQRLRAILARKTGNTEKARECFQAYVSQDSGNGFAYLDYAQFLEESGDAPSAVEIYKTVKTRFPKTKFEDIANNKLDALGSKDEGGAPPAVPAPAPAEAPAPDSPPAPKVEPGKVKY